MHTPARKKFLVLYQVPGAVMADWARTDPAVRQAAEQTLKAEWGRWLGDHAGMMTLTEAAGAARKVTADGIADTPNDIMLYSIVEADSLEAASQAFVQHPQLTIPQASIQVMELRPL